MWTPCWNIFLFLPLNICKNHAANLLRSRMQISQGFRLKQDFKRGCITFTLYVPRRTKLIFNISKKEKARVSALLCLCYSTWLKRPKSSSRQVIFTDFLPWLVLIGLLSALRRSRLFSEHSSDRILTGPDGGVITLTEVHRRKQESGSLKTNLNKGGTKLLTFGCLCSAPSWLHRVNNCADSFVSF